MPNVVTIREAVQRAKADGLPVSEYTLRQWVRSGAVPTRKAGNKVLLFYPNLVQYLTCSGSVDLSPSMVAGPAAIYQADN